MSAKSWSVVDVTNDPTEESDAAENDYFKAAINLQFDQVKKIIEEGQVDVNCHCLYFYANISKKADHHSRQCFEYVKSGRVTLQLFERIDHFAGDDAKNLLLLLKV